MSPLRIVYAKHITPELNVEENRKGFFKENMFEVYFFKTALCILILLIDIFYII